MTTLSSTDVALAYLNVPEDEYRLSLDAALLWLNASSQALLAACSSPFFAVELLKRCSAPLYLLSSPGLDAASFVEAAASWAWGSLAACPAPPAGWSATLVAEVHRSSFPTLLAELTQSALPGARLAVLGSTPLRHLLPAWRSLPMPSSRPAGPFWLLRCLRRQGWQVQAVSGYHTPLAGLWGVFFRLAQSLGRQDLADRALLASRWFYARSGLVGYASPVLLVQAVCP